MSITFHLLNVLAIIVVLSHTIFFRLPFAGRRTPMVTLIGFTACSPRKVNHWHFALQKIARTLYDDSRLLHLPDAKCVEVKKIGRSRRSATVEFKVIRSAPWPQRRIPGLRLICRAVKRRLAQESSLPLCELPAVFGGELSHMVIHAVGQPTQKVRTSRPIFIFCFFFSKFLVTLTVYRPWL